MKLTEETRHAGRKTCPSTTLPPFPNGVAWVERFEVVLSSYGGVKAIPLQTWTGP